MPDPIDPRIHPDEDSFVESFRDPSRGAPSREELPARNNTVLLAGYRGNYPI
jgi:hypothetical protein